MRVAVLDDYLNVALELGDWSPLDGRAEITVFDQAFAGEDDAAAKLADFEAVIGMRERTAFPASLLKRLPKLKLLITTGMRNASFDMKAAKAQGITVCGTGGRGQATAELTWALILGLVRNLPAHDAAMRSGKWQTVMDGDLYGKTLGVIGLGKLGGAVATVGKAFGMNVLAWSQNLTEERATEIGAKKVDKDTLLAESDFVTIHVVLSERSRGLIGGAELAKMKPTACLINTSRGPIVDRDALVDALKTRRIAGAGIDVYETEPAPADHPLRKLPNVLLTPHMGYVATDNISKMYSDAAADVAAFMDGKPVRVIE